MNSPFTRSEPAPKQSPARRRPASAPHSPGSHARRALQTSRAPGCRNGEQTFCMWCERGTPTPLSFQCAFSRGRHGVRAAQSPLWGPSWPVHPTTLSGPWRCRKQCGAERRDSKPRLLRPQMTALARGLGGRQIHLQVRIYSKAHLFQRGQTGVPCMAEGPGPTKLSPAADGKPRGPAGRALSYLALRGTPHQSLVT